jgi:AMP nucleosidase
MKEKPQIVENWLPRYTGVPLDQFGAHILLTNFGGYLGHFARVTGAEVVGQDRPMPSATADGITMINFGMGSPNAATAMDLLSAIKPKAVVFLGKCGGLKRKNQLGDFCRLPRSAAKARPTITCCPKSPHCPRRVAACRVDDDPRPRPRLLDRHGLHD